MKKVVKNDLVRVVHNRLNGAVPKLLVRDAITFIFDHVEEQLINYQSFSVHNFGTLSPYINHQHIRPDWQTGKLVEAPATYTVRFRLSLPVRKTFIDRQKRFLQKK